MVFSPAAAPAQAVDSSQKVLRLGIFLKLTNFGLQAATCLQSRAFARDAWQQLTAREEQHSVELAAVRAQVAAVNAQVAAAHAQLDFTEDELERSHAEEEAARQKLASVEKRLQNLSESTLQTILDKDDEIQVRTWHSAHPKTVEHVILQTTGVQGLDDRCCHRRL